MKKTKLIWFHKLDPSAGHRDRGKVRRGIVGKKEEWRWRGEEMLAGRNRR